MFYTSTELDSMPLTQMQLTFNPCMNPNDIETPPSNQYYKLEVQGASKCYEEPNTKKYYDPRYKYLGLKVDEYTLLTETGIFNTLSRLPEYNEQVYDP